MSFSLRRKKRRIQTTEDAPNGAIQSAEQAWQAEREAIAARDRTERAPQAVTPEAAAETLARQARQERAARELAGRELTSRQSEEPYPTAYSSRTRRRARGIRRVFSI